MKIVPVNGVIGNESHTGEKLDWNTAPVRWDRHVPEDYFEQQLFSQAIAHNVWETVSSGQGYMIPIQLKDARDGCIAELSLPDSPNWDEAGKLVYEHWDGQGRLQGTIFVHDFSPRVYQSYDNDPRETELVEFRKARAFEEAQQFPIFYSIMSSLDYVFSKRDVNIVFEVAATPFSRADQTNFGFYGHRQNLRPILEVPPGHEFYEAGGHKRPRTVQHGYVPAPDQDNDVSHIRDNFPDKESYENWVDSSD